MSGENGDGGRANIPVFWGHGDRRRTGGCWHQALWVILSHCPILPGPLPVSLAALDIGQLHKISLGVISLEKIRSKRNQALCPPASDKMTETFFPLTQRFN